MDDTPPPGIYERATETANFVRSKLPEELKNPRVAIVCGSGLGGLSDTIDAEPKVQLSYKSIPHFPQSTGKSSLTHADRDHGISQKSHDSAIQLTITLT